jgi:hypothetical protein
MPHLDAKLIFVVLGAIFLIMGLTSWVKAGRIQPAAKAWLTIGVIFSAVSAWLWL